MQGNMFELMQLEQQKKELKRLLSCNEKTESFGLVLTEEEATALMAARHDTLIDQRRVEFGEGILPKIVETFCDSQYLEQEEYADTLAALQEVFYLYKNESEDLLTDDELLEFMKEQFEGVCYGSVEYLEETCLERFSRAIRAGYEGYIENEGRSEYEKFTEEMRWDKEIYQRAVEELFGWK